MEIGADAIQAIGSFQEARYGGAGRFEHFNFLDFQKLPILAKLIVPAVTGNKLPRVRSAAHGDRDSAISLMVHLNLPLTRTRR
jgi:hypothetical protein